MTKIRMITSKGVPTIEVTGVCGPGCADLSRPFEHALGTVESNTPTDEYFQVTSQTEEQGQ